MKQKSPDAFKDFVKKRMQEFEFRRLMKIKQSHSKLDNLNYTKLEMQQYLKMENLKTEEAQTLFKYRVWMANFGEHFRGKAESVPCPLCGLHLDNQTMAFSNCQVISDNVEKKGSYETIFNKDVPAEVVETLKNIDKFRTSVLNK